jgi:hypothetical protein
MHRLVNLRVHMGELWIWMSCWRLKGVGCWLWLCGEGEERLWPDKSGRCVALTYLPLLDEELGSVPERCDIYIILKLRIYRMVDDLFV